MLAELESVWARGGCVLCDSAEFERDGFGRQTVLICDQCEREFHVGCLLDHHMADLSELPKGKLWPPLSNVHRCSASKHPVMLVSSLCAYMPHGRASRDVAVPRL